MRLKLLFFGLFFGVILLHAQTPNTQDCNGAIQVCQPVYTTTNSISGVGNVPNEINPLPPVSNCLFSGEQNGVWYQFTTQSAGLLCFTIDPTNNGEDFDFSLFNLTGSLCSAIATTASLKVACNFNTYTIWNNVGGGTDPSKQGNTGLFPPSTYTSSNTQTGPCINVPSGASYALYVSAASLPNSGYTLSFPPSGTTGMADVVDITPPQMNSVTSSTNCGITSLNFNFSEDVLCSTVGASNFQLTGPDGIHTISSITSTVCSAGGAKDKSFIVNFSPALHTGGAYQLCLTNATGFVTDACGNQAPAACLNFTITGPTSSFTPVNPETCPGASITFSNTGSGTIHSWSFSSGSPSTSSALNPPAVTWATAGSYSITHSVTTGACVSKTTHTIIVNTPPTSTVTVQHPTCSSTTGSATINASGGNPAYTYNWISGAGTASLATNLTAGTSYTVEVTDSKSCKSIKTFTVGPLINTSAAFTASSNKCLTNNSFTFTNTGTSSGTHSYSFSPAVGSPSSQTGTTVVTAFTAAGTYVVTHQVNLGVGCIFTQTLQVTVYPNPTSLTLNAFNTICSQPNGSITVSGSTGGTPGYQYNLNGGVYTNTLSYTSLSAGTHTVGVQDVNGCIFTNTVIITDTPGPSALTLSTTPASCNANDGSIIINGVVGGTAPYVYSFNGGPFTATSPITGLGAGSYSISVKDANNCIYATSVNVVNPLAPTNVVLTTTNTACIGNTGIIQIGSVTGGTPSYSFSVNGGAFSTVLTYTGQAVGSHTVIVKDANNCTFNAAANVVMEAGPSLVSITPTHIGCGGVNGAITIGAVTGGVPAYVYSLNGAPSSTNTSYTGLGAGTYTVITTDGNGCIHKGTTTILSTTSPTASISSYSNVSCNGGNDGSAVIIANAGTPGYTYTISPSGVSNGTGIFSSISAGNYTLIVSDAVGCITTQTLVITEPVVLTASIFSQIDVSCFGGNDGEVVVTGKDGTGPYQYSLNGGAFQNSSTFSGLSAGNYSVTVKDNNGCTSIQNVIITEPPVLSLMIGSSPANCNSADGIAVVTPSGGTPVYAYAWTGAGGTASTSNPIAPGTYSVTVTDSKGCVKTTSVVVGVKGGAVVTISAFTPVTCFGFANGSATTSMVGPNSGPYSYTWSPSGGNASTANNLVAGNYTVTGSNIFGCQSTATVTIIQPTQLTATVTTTAATCNAGNDATANLAIGGGISPYSYLWNPSGITTNSISNIAGNYTYSVTDGNGCILSNTLALTQPNPLAITPTFTLPGCGQSNGSASINNSTTGGTSPYSYLWSNGSNGQLISNIGSGTYTCTVTDAHLCAINFAINVVNPASPSISVTAVSHVSCNGGNDGTTTINVSGGNPAYTYSWSTVPVQTTPTAVNLTQGNYNVTIRDANGCTTSTSVPITEPLPLTITTTSVNPKCVGNADGTATAFPNGGTLPYSYSWSSTPTQTNSIANGLIAGTYFVTVKDAKLCITTQSVVLTNPPAINVSITSTNVNCFSACDGMAEANVINAVGTVSYLWNDGNAQTTKVANFLCNGNYTVSVTDGNNCNAKNTVSISEPTVLTATISSSGNVICNGGNNGFAQATPTGGTAGYTYSWSNGSTLASINGVVANTYSVTITDTHSCTATTQITITEPSAVSAILSGTNISCNGSNNGNAVVNYGGGVGPYTFIWQPSLQTAFNATNLAPGTHTVTVTDINNCVSTSTILLTEPPILSVTTVSVTSSNCLQANGSACASVSGGVSPYSYLWSNGATSSCNNGITANFYTVTVTDAKTCTTVASVNINDIAAPTVSITSSNSVTCFNGHDGSATAAFSGGVAPYTTSWTTTTFTALTISNITTGTYNYKVIDGAGCIGSSFVVIPEPTQLVSLTSSPNHLKCYGVCTGSVLTLANGGTLPYTYSWNDINNQSTNAANFLCAGMYTCTVTDANNCTTTNSITITEPTLLTVHSVTTTPISCFGLSDGGFAITPKGGTPGYTYSWTPSGGNNSFIYGLNANTYSVTVGDANGCVANKTYTLVQPSQITVVSTSTNSTCFSANGSAEVVVAGGTPGYSYNWNTSTIQQNSVVNGLLAGPWVCTITDSRGCSIIETTTVVNTPVPTITSIIYTSPVCNGQLNADIIINGTPGITPTSYIWSGPSILQTTTTNTLSGIGAGLYNIQVKDANNCIATGVVNVIEPSALSLTVSPVTTICYGQSFQIYAAALGATPPYTYNWTPGNFNGGGPHLVSPTSSTVYPVTVTDSKGCTIPSSQIILNVNPPLNAVSQNTTACDGDIISLNSTANGGNGGPYNYMWTNGATTQTNSITADALLSPMTYSVLISDGCSTPITSSLTVTVNPKSTGNFNSNNLAGCEDLYVILTATSSVASDTYSWNFGDASSVGTGYLVGHTYFNPGVYSPTLQITNTFGCVTSINKPNYIQVYPKPTASFTMDPSSTDIISSTINFTDQSLLAVDWSWNFGDVNAGQLNYSSFQNPNHDFNLAGDYDITLLVTSVDGCKDAVVHRISVSPEFVIYVPNAFTPNGNGKNDVFQPKGIGINEDKYELLIFDRWGEIIFTSNNFNLGWNGLSKGNGLAKEDVYVWKITVTDLTDLEHKLMGHVTLIK